MNLKSSVKSLTQRCRAAESAEKVQKSDRKKNRARKISESFFTQLVKTNTYSRDRDNLCELCYSAPLREI